MKLATKLVVSLVIGLVGATVVSTIKFGQPFDPLLLVAFSMAAVAAALVGAGGTQHIASPDRASAITRADSTPSARAAGAKPTTTGTPAAAAAGAVPGSRVLGQVKWFNISKGFGFIVTDAGQEVFVHFRSIRGGGRRGLKDGQRVSFVLADSEKGPQAEDVVAEGRS